MLVEDEDELLAKVIDFGLAKASVAAGADGAVKLSKGGFVGSPPFASPEQWEDREIDTRSDIYSLGITLWFMLTGQPPFAGSVTQVMSQHFSKPPPFEKLEKLPSPVTDVLRKMIAKDPDERFQTPSELRKAIETVLENSAHIGAALAPDADAAESPEDFATLTDYSLLRPDDGSIDTETPIANRYQIAQSCGETNEGRVFRAYDTERRREVRLIVLHPETLGDQIALSAIEREVEKLATVRHPQLLGVFGFETAEPGSFLVLEWTEGFSLLDLLKARRKLNADEALMLLDQAARGIDHALSIGLMGLGFGLHQMRIHFPEPIESETLLRAPISEWPNFALKLYPLGAARDIANSQTWAGEQTMPEGGDQRAAADARSEYIQALAVVAYELLGGTLSPIALCGPEGSGARYTPLSTLSEGGNEVLRRALDPSRSFPSARAFSAALAKQDGMHIRRHDPKPVSIAPQSDGTPPPPPAPEKPRRTILKPAAFAGLLAAVVAVIASIFFVLHLIEERTSNSAEQTLANTGTVHPSASGAASSSGAAAVDNAAGTPPSPPPATPTPATPPPTRTQEEMLRASVSAAQALEAKGDWSASLEAWLRVTREHPEYAPGKSNLETLLSHLRDRPTPITPGEFQGMRKQITEAGNLGILPAMLLLGDNLRKAEPREAFAWYSKAAEKGSATAETALGFMLSQGAGVDQPDLVKAFEHFQIAANKGDIGGKFALGQCYRAGFGVAKDVNRAVKLLREAADAGDTRAMNDLGDCYVHGDGVEKNLETAFMLFSKAKERGNLNATGNLGVLYLNGDGVAANPKKAVEIFAGGADAGDSFCMLLYAYCLENGKGVVQNSLQAIAWYRKAAEAGNRKAIEWCIQHSVTISNSN